MAHLLAAEISCLGVKSGLGVEGGLVAAAVATVLWETVVLRLLAVGPAPFSFLQHFYGLLGTSTRITFPEGLVVRCHQTPCRFSLHENEGIGE